MKPPPQITKNTARLLEANLAASENKRARKERMLHIVWIVGLVSGCLWMTHDAFFGRGIFGALMLAVWVISMIIYLRLWDRARLFFYAPFGPRETQNAFARLPNETRVIRGTILFICPWVTGAVAIIILAFIGKTP